MIQWLETAFIFTDLNSGKFITPDPVMSCRAEMIFSSVFSLLDPLNLLHQPTPNLNLNYNKDQKKKRVVKKVIHLNKLKQDTK